MQLRGRGVRYGILLTTGAGLLLLLLLQGCGGGGGSAGPQPPVTPTATPYSAHFSVDVTTGAVTVTSPNAGTGTMNTSAILTGTAVSFQSSRLVDEDGNIGVKALEVHVTNNTQRQLTNAQLLFSDMTNVGSWSDPRPQVQVSTLAGTGAAGYGDGAALAAQMREPVGVAVDDAGDVYIADYANHYLRKLSSGYVTTVAGNGTANSANGVGSLAKVKYPAGIVYCPRDDAIFIAERYGNRVSRLDSTGYLCTIAGNGTAGGADGPGSTATFSSPVGLATDGNSLYVAEYGGHRVRQIIFTGSDPRKPGHYTVSTVAGSGTAGTVDGTGTSAQFNGPWGLAYGDDGALYVAELSGRCIRRIELSSGRVVTVAGIGTSGSVNGLGSVASFNNPSGIVALPDRGTGRVLVVAEASNHDLRQVRLLGDGTADPSQPTSWLVQTLAGEPATSGNVNGNGTAARFNGPSLVTADASGNLIVADRMNHQLRRVRPNSGFFPVGTVTGAAPAEPVVLANAAGLYPVAGGTSRPYLSCPNLAAGATSPALNWTFAVPQGVTAFEFTVTLAASTNPYSPVEAVDGDDSGGLGSGNVLVRTFVGSTANENGFIDGQGVNARFSCVIGMSMDAQGVLYAADADNNRLCRIEPSGRVETIAGVYGAGAGSTDGRGNVAKLNYPPDVAVMDSSYLSSGDSLPPGTQTTYLVVTDLDNDRIRLVRSPYEGWDTSLPWEPWNAYFYQVATIAGSTSGYANGAGTVAQFAAPSSVAVGPGGIVYVCERTGGSRVRALRYTGGNPMSAANWQVSLLAGDPAGASGYVNATGSSARFYDPRGITVNQAGEVLVADTYNYCIRKITPGGAVTTLAGTDSFGYADATGTAARFYCPWDIAAGPDGYCYVADRYNHRIRRVSPTGVVTTVAGTGSSSLADGPGDQAHFNDDLGITVSAGGDLYLAEAECIRVLERVVNVGTIASAH